MEAPRRQKGTISQRITSHTLEKGSILFTKNKRDFYTCGIYCDSEGIVISLYLHRAHSMCITIIGDAVQKRFNPL